MKIFKKSSLKAFTEKNLKSVEILDREKLTVIKGGNDSGNCTICSFADGYMRCWTPPNLQCEEAY